jgi:hypothetical protein
MNLRELIKEALEKQLDKTLVLKENIDVSEVLKYHIDNGLSLTNNIFKVYSESYFDLINEVRELYSKGVIDLNEEDSLMVKSDFLEKDKLSIKLFETKALFLYLI